ncbi:MAG TPA: TonB-dependent receptor [Opitutaceae bacterium]|nr:TonB-dependent receptor [Opitutaceae bacterium]
MALAACFLAFSFSARADDTRAFDVPAGAADQTLKQFATQAAREIVFAPETVGGVQTNAIQGQLTPQDAIDRMLANTALVASQDKTGAFAVRRRAAVNVAAADPAPAPAAGDQVVKLSPFEVSSETKGRYEALDEASGGRVRVSLMDAPQSVTVITHELIEDVGADRILDAAKYAAGVTESTIPNAQDRTNIRGFQTDGATIDGFNFFSFSNLDPVIIDRLEIVKGPDAILSPQIVSGTLNVISKKPVFADQGSADIQVGRFDADRAEFDVNQAVSGQFAVRVVGAAEHAHDQASGNFNDSQLVMPMFTYRFGPSTQITAQAQVYNSYNAAYGGVPVDFSVGTNDTARLIPGVPESLDFYGLNIRRHSEGQHYRVFLETQPTDQFSARLALNTIHWTGDSVGLSIGNPIDPTTNTQVAEMGTTSGMIQLNPATGAWFWTGQNIANPIFNEQPTAGTWGFQTRRYLNLQNDYTYQVKFGDNQSTTVAGYMVDYLKNPGWSYNFSVPNLNVRGFVRAPITVGTVASNNYSISWDQQVYATEQLSLFKDMLTGFAGVAESSYRQYTNDLLHRATSQNRVHATLPSTGLIFRPIPEVAFFADTSRQSQPNGTSPATGTNPVTTGKQYEFGVRTQLFDKRVYATLTYFNINQNNFSIPNQANATVPPPAIPFPPIFTDRRDKGVEFETTSAITDQISIVGNVSYEHDRTPLGQVFRGVADTSAAAFLNYTFDKKGPLAGLSAGIGVDYLGKRAGDNPSATPTSASTPSNLILPLPSFWLPARTLVNAMVSYKIDHNWQAQLNVDNLTDQDYLAASTGRNNVFPGTPINPRLTLSYKF